MSGLGLAVTETKRHMYTYKRQTPEQRPETDMPE
jgi:hypothetical protein